MQSNLNMVVSNLNHKLRNNGMKTPRISEDPALNPTPPHFRRALMQLFKVFRVIQMFTVAVSMISMLLLSVRRIDVSF